MADFGILTALQGKDNWAQKRQDKQAALGYQSALNKLAEQDIAQAQQAQAAQQEYLNQLKNITILQPDMERIRTVESELRPNIAEKIKKYNGDVAKYMKYEGMTDLNRYVKDLLNNETTLRAISNAKAAAAYQADANAGLMERFDIDPNTGAPLNSFAQQLAGFESGDTDTLNYRGGFKPAKFDEKIFSDIYGSENRYKQKNVDTKDYFNTAYRALQESGLNPSDAMQQASMLAQNYQNHLAQKGTPLKFKWDAPPKVKAGKGNGEDDDEVQGLYMTAVDLFAGKPDYLQPSYQESYRTYDTEKQKTTNMFGATTEQDVKVRRKLPRTGSNQLVGRKIGKYNYVDNNGKITSVDDVIEQVFRNPDGSISITTTSSNDKYQLGSAPYPDIVYKDPLQLTKAIVIGSQSEGGDATKANKLLGKLNKLDADLRGAYGNNWAAISGLTPEQQKQRDVIMKTQWTPNVAGAPIQQTNTVQTAPQPQFKGLPKSGGFN